MTKIDKFLSVLLSGLSDNNINFSDLCTVLLQLGFKRRIKGDHHIFFKDQVDEIINIQPVGSKAKAYKIKQVRNIILKYKLGDIQGE